MVRPTQPRRPARPALIVRLVTLLLVLPFSACHVYAYSTHFWHVDYAGEGSSALGASPLHGHPSQASTDDCDDAHVMLRVSAGCALAATWMGGGAGAASIDPGQRCVLDDPSVTMEGGRVVVQVEQGTVTLGADLLQVSLEGALAEAHGGEPAGARARFRFTGARRQGEQPSLCAVPPVVTPARTRDAVAALVRYEAAHDGRARLGLATDDWYGSVVVLGVLPEGPADGKIRAGDVILAVDGQSVTETAALAPIVDAHAGQQLDFTVRRSGRERTVTIYLGR